MVILGAGGHAIEILDVLINNGEIKEKIYFFDNTRKRNSKNFLFEYPILTDEEALNITFKKSPNFVLGLGNPQYRERLANLAQKKGGILNSVIASSAIIGTNDIRLGAGLNIMHSVIISSTAIIGKGTLINAKTNIHHHCFIGEFCEIGPGCTIAGRVSIGDYCTLGTNVTIIPNVRISDHVIIGAGAVVTKDLVAPGVYVGVPAILLGSN